eukprot:sb/3470414/
MLLMIVVYLLAFSLSEISATGKIILSLNRDATKSGATKSWSDLLLRFRLDSCREGCYDNLGPRGNTSPDKDELYTGCTDGDEDLPVQPPVEVDKIWMISKTATAYIITCNGVEVVNYLFADSSNNYCVKHSGSGDVEKIKFNGEDLASDFYRASSVSLVIGPNEARSFLNQLFKTNPTQPELSFYLIEKVREPHLPGCVGFVLKS